MTMELHEQCLKSNIVRTTHFVAMKIQIDPNGRQLNSQRKYKRTLCFGKKNYVSIAPIWTSIQFNRVHRKRLAKHKFTASTQCLSRFHPTLTISSKFTNKNKTKTLTIRAEAVSYKLHLQQERHTIIKKNILPKLLISNI